MIAVGVSPDNVPLRKHLAALLMRQGRPAEAEVTARRALEERLGEQSHLPRLIARDRCLLAAALAAALLLPVDAWAELLSAERARS